MFLLGEYELEPNLISIGVVSLQKSNSFSLRNYWDSLLDFYVECVNIGSISWEFFNIETVCLGCHAYKILCYQPDTLQIISFGQFIKMDINFNYKWAVHI